MCVCTPESRTPFCGKPGCEWPKQPGQPIEVVGLIEAVDDLLDVVDCLGEGRSITIGKRVLDRLRKARKAFP